MRRSNLVSVHSGKEQCCNAVLLEEQVQGCLISPDATHSTERHQFIVLVSKGQICAPVLVNPKVGTVLCAFEVLRLERLIEIGIVSATHEEPSKVPWQL